MVNPMDLTGRHILITGASSGIGRACMIRASQLGARVTGIARRERELQETVALLSGGGHGYYCCDCGQIDALEGLANELVEDRGAIHGLVYCAGVGDAYPLKLSTPGRARGVMDVNFFAFLELVRLFSNKKRYETGASFIGISSVMSQSGQKGNALYSASKAAMDGAVRCMAKELAPKIRVNTIQPGWMGTDMYNNRLSAGTGGDGDGAVDKRQQLGLGKPDDVADMACYLLSGAAQFITGTAVVVDGGYLS